MQRSNREVDATAEHDRRQIEVDRLDASSEDDAAHEPCRDQQSAGRRELEAEGQPAPDLPLRQPRPLAPIPLTHSRPHRLQGTPPEARGQRRGDVHRDDAQERRRREDTDQDEDPGGVDDGADGESKCEEPEPISEIGREPASEKGVLQMDRFPLAGRLALEPAAQLVHFARPAFRAPPARSRAWTSDGRPQSSRIRRQETSRKPRGPRRPVSASSTVRAT